MMSGVYKCLMSMVTHTHTHTHTLCPHLYLFHCWLLYTICYLTITTLVSYAFFFCTLGSARMVLTNFI